jgi:hypothetical protein
MYICVHLVTLYGKQKKSNKKIIKGNKRKIKKNKEKEKILYFLFFILIINKIEKTN